MIESSRPLEFKLVVLGSSGVGKSTFKSCDTIADLEKRYIPTQGAIEHPFTFFTSSGPVLFRAWDSAARAYSLRDSFYAGAACAILMVDVTSRVSYLDVRKWHKELTQVCGTLPTALVANKVDLPNRVLNNIDFHERHGLLFCEVSAKTSYQWEVPFILLARELLGDPNLSLVEQPVLAHRS